jgi:Uncharacterized protein conserved in bacteria (DUF2314)
VPHEWRTHPDLQGRLQPDHPDDVQVIVHEGGPRISDRKPELVWITVTASGDNVFTGKILNQPTQLQTVHQGDQIYFVVPGDEQQPLRVTEKYLRERPHWIIYPCEKCGLSELFDAPSDLMKATFRDLPDGAVVEAFTAICGMCGGPQSVQLKDDVLVEPHTKAPARKWWQFWK